MPEATIGLDAGGTTLAEALKGVGTTCAGVFGKWHLGDKPPFHPPPRIRHVVRHSLFERHVVGARPDEAEVAGVPAAADLEGRRRRRDGRDASRDRRR
jgi:hypothetical protein